MSEEGGIIVDTIGEQGVTNTVTTPEPSQKPEVQAESKPESSEAATLGQEPAEPSKPLTVEELQRKFDSDAAKQRRRYERDLRDEREARIRLEEQLKSARPAAQQTVPEDSGPTLESCEYDQERYIAEKAAWVAQKHVEKTFGELGKRAEAERARAEAARETDVWNKKVALALKEIPDYNEVVADSQLPLTGAMKQAIMEMDGIAGPKMVHYLATHESEAEAIAAMTPLGTVRALMRIEDSFKVKPTTSTPAPIVPTGSKQTAGLKSLTDSMSQDEFEKRRRAYIGKR